MVTKKRNLLVLIPALALALAAGCSRGTGPEEGAGLSGVQERTGPVSTNKEDYPVFPDADAGADPAVPAEQGGKGFTGQGWETNTDFDLVGDPQALKGGVFRDHLQDFPGTLRMEGPESNSFFNYSVTTMAYESLLGLHPTTLDYMPALATHWQVSDDKMTFRFRLNPNARFSDGQPVTAEDVVATFDFLMDPTLQSPSNQITFGKIERPVSYVRGNFIYGREFLGDGDLDAQRLVWLEQTANARVHGTTKEVPRVRFERDERHLLRPVATATYHPLVLPPERLTRATLSATGPRRSATQTHVRQHVVVERRPLVAYTHLVEPVVEQGVEAFDGALEGVVP